MYWRVYMSKKESYAKKKIEKELIFHNEKNFFVRIRPDSNKDGFVYYNGIKVYTVNSRGIKANINLLKFNETNLLKVKNGEKKKDDLISVLSSERDYYYKNLKVKKISFQAGEVAKDNKKLNDALNEIDIFVKKITRNNISGTLYCKKEHIINEKTMKKLKDPYIEYYYEFENGISINDEYEIAKKLFLEFKEKKYDKEYNIFKEIKFTLKEFVVEDNDKKMETIDSKIKRYISHTETFVKNYFNYTKFEDEKKYQHTFLLNADKTDLLKGARYFEEEYNIKDDSKNGRIDCIFYKINGNLITDIYLIELKVNEKVLGGSNGIHKHLTDIRNNIDDHEFEHIKDLINYRETVLNDKITNYSLASNFNKYFYIIIAWEKDKLNDVMTRLEELNNLDSSIYKQEDMKNYQNTTIKDIYKTVNNVKVKIFIDKKRWDKSSDNLDSEFEDKYDYILKG